MRVIEKHHVYALCPSHDPGEICGGWGFVCGDGPQRSNQCLTGYTLFFVLCAYHPRDTDCLLPSMMGDEHVTMSLLKQATLGLRDAGSIAALASGRTACASAAISTMVSFTRVCGRAGDALVPITGVQVVDTYGSCIAPREA